MYRLTSHWPLKTLKSQKYPIYNNKVPPRPKFGCLLLYTRSLKIEKKKQTKKKRKCPKWPKKYFEHLTIKGTLMHLVLVPGAQLFVRFAPPPAVWRCHKFYKCPLTTMLNNQKQKSEMHRMTSKWPQTLHSQKYVEYTKYLSPRPKFWSASLYSQSTTSCFPDTRLSKIENAPFDLRMTLNT